MTFFPKRVSPSRGGLDQHPLHHYQLFGKSPFPISSLVTAGMHPPLIPENVKISLPSYFPEMLMSNRDETASIPQAWMVPPGGFTEWDRGTRGRDTIRGRGRDARVVNEVRIEIFAVWPKQESPDVWIALH